jgi:NUMOD3 motif
LGFPKGSKRQLSKEWIEKLRQVHRGNKYCVGRVQSKETRLKISKSMIGYIITEQTRRRMSIGQIACWKRRKENQKQSK